MLVSHPTWVRGLKHILDDNVLRVHEVAPYVGAWIETFCERDNRAHGMSHPTWVRGLKLNGVIKQIIVICRTLRGCVD